MKKHTKRILLIISALICLPIMTSGFHTFDSAKNGIDLVQGLFWIIVGTVACITFIENAKKNEWPWE